MELNRRLAAAAPAAPVAAPLAVALAVALAFAAPSALRAQGAPDPRAAQALIREADSLFTAERYADALARYESALLADSTASRAVFRVAVLRSWRGDLEVAIALHRRYLVLEPRDEDGRMALARVLAWAGQYDEALTMYRAAGASSPEGAKGEARVLTWKGDLVGGEAAWASLSQRYPDDAEVWVGLAQVRRWRGNPRGARAAVNEALSLKPGDADALEQRRWLDAELDPSGGVTMAATHDSDDNDAFAVAVHGGVALPVGRRLDATATLRRATAGSLDGHAVSALFRWGLHSRDGKLSAQFGAGITSLTASALPGGSAPDATLAFGSARVAAQFGTRVFAGVGASRAPFDEVAGTIRTGVVLDLGDADVSVRLPHRVTVGAAAHRGAVARGPDGANSRWGAGGSIGWTYRRNITLTARTRAFGYDRAAGDGYFSPERFQLSELAAGWYRDESYGWQAGVDLAAGSQRIRVAGSEASTRNAWSAAASGGFRWRPGVECSVKATFANVASPATVFGDAEYRYTAVSALLRWLF